MCNELNLEMWLIASQRTDSDFNLQDVLGVICLFSPESVEGKVGDVLVCFRRTESVRFLTLNSRIIASLDQDNLAAKCRRRTRSICTNTNMIVDESVFGFKSFLFACKHSLRFWWSLVTNYVRIKVKIIWFQLLKCGKLLDSLLTPNPNPNPQL